MIPTRSLAVRERRRANQIDSALLRRITRHVLDKLVKAPEYDLAVFVVEDAEMTHLNETYLSHQGSTDVITFDYNDPAAPNRLAGEIFVCFDEAKRQAVRYRTSWQSEIARYVVHGILHLAGYDDKTTGDRREMKRIEGRVLEEVERAFECDKLDRHDSKSSNGTRRRSGT
jgi:probable rRNA maturation factor